MDDTCVHFRNICIQYITVRVETISFTFVGYSHKCRSEWGFSKLKACVDRSPSATHSRSTYKAMLLMANIIATRTDCNALNHNVLNTASVML